MTESNEDESTYSIIWRLRQCGRGKYVWRVQDKDDKSYYIEFEEWNEQDAKCWWREYSGRNICKNMELVKVRTLSQEDRLMHEAADMLEFFLGQMQMHSPKMNNQHSWRFSGGWPMTHCVGANSEDAVKAAMQEMKRDLGEKS